MSTSKLQRWVNETPERAREYARESLLIDVSEEILAALAAAGINKAALAERLGFSKSHITQLLSGERNMTLRSLADISFALNRKPCFTLLKADQHVAWLDELSVVFRPRRQVSIVDVTMAQGAEMPTVKEACNAPAWRDAMQAADVDAA